jgi:hypothetical protein
MMYVSSSSSGGFWAPDGAELTPTMKLKRRAIAEKYAADAEALYAADDRSSSAAAKEAKHDGCR